MKHWRLFAALTVLAFAYLYPKTASASLVVCNEAGKKLHVVIGWVKSDCSACVFETRGWWLIAPASCKTMLDLDLSLFNAYIYAYQDYSVYSSGEYKGMPKTPSWPLSGQQGLCVNEDQSFHYVDAARACPERSKMEGFLQIPVPTGAQDQTAYYEKDGKLGVPPTPALPRHP